MAVDNRTKKTIWGQFWSAHQVSKQFIIVVVNFYLCQVIFVFLLFLGMVMYANKVETKEKQKLPEIKD